MPITRNKIKEWLIAGGVTLLKGAMLLVVLNLVLYLIIVARRPPMPRAQQAPSNPNPLALAYPGWKEDDIQTLQRETYRKDEYQYQPFTEFRQRPFRGEFVNVDAAGFRISKDQAPWPPDPKAMSVFVFGGSTTFGSGLPDDQAIPSYLQEFANADHPTRPVAIYNFGQPGYFSSQEAIYFQQLLQAGFVPQIAVFVDGVNDFLFAEGKPLFYARFRNLMDRKPEGTTLADLPMIKAAHWLRDKWGPPESQPPRERIPPNDDPEMLRGAANRWLANKRMIEVIAKDYGVRPVFVWQPVPTYKYDIRYHQFTWLHQDLWHYAPRCKYGYALMESLRAQGKLGSNVLWLADIQQNKHENLYVDSVHYNAAFSKEVAEQIYGFLIRSLAPAANSLTAQQR